MLRATVSEGYVLRLEERLVEAQEKLAAVVASLRAIESPGDLPKGDLTYTQTLTHGILLGQHALAQSVLKFLTTGDKLE
jgi:hypothetical protein